jgi:chromate transporter
MSSIPSERPVPTIRELFVGFALAGLSGFGGVLPFARRMMVEERKWMTPEEFNESFSLAQFVPGPNVLNLAVVFGARTNGALGALVAALALLAAPIAIVISLGALYALYGQFGALPRILAGIAAAAAGLIIAASAKMVEPLLRRAAGPAPYLAAAVFLAFGILRWPMWWVIAAALPLSLALTFWWRR